MRVFVSGVAADEEQAKYAVGAAPSAVSFNPAGLVRVWEKRRGRVFGALYSNEGNRPGVVELEDGRVVLWSGYTGQSDMAAFFARNLSASTGPVTLREVTGGIAAFTLIDFSRGMVWGWSTQPGVEPIYYSDTRISNRPRGVCDGKAVFNADFLDWYMSTGYPLDAVTPLAGVRSLLADEMIRIDAHGASPCAHPNPPAIYRDMPLAEMAVAGAQALETAVRPLRSFDRVELFLSNGKDSRLLAAALSHCGISGVATTMHLTDRSAIRIVGEVARVAGLPVQEKAEPFRVEDVPETMVSVLKRAEGLLNCEANVDMVPWSTSFDHRQAIIFGHSHLQKGGLLRGHVESKTHALNLLRRRFDNLLASEALRQRVKNHLGNWIEDRDDVEPGHAMYWAAHDFRVTHYLRAHYQRFSSLGVPVYPLIDENFARFCGASNMMLKVDESFLFSMLTLMCPPMRDLPMSRHRWKFELDGPDPRFPGYEARVVLEPQEDHAGDREQSIWWSSRLVAIAREAILASELRDELLSRVSGDMRKAVTDWDGGPFFPGAPSRRLARIQLYRMYSAAVLQSDVFETGVA